jgi:hypothetical protein
MSALVSSGGAMTE